MQRRQLMTVVNAGVAGVLAGGMAMRQTHDYTTARQASLWSRPVQLSGNGAIGSPGGTHPLALDKTVYAAWVQNGVNHLNTSSNGGATWGPDVRRINNEWHSRHPQIMRGMRSDVSRRIGLLSAREGALAIPLSVNPFVCKTPSAKNQSGLKGLNGPGLPEVAGLQSVPRCLRCL